MIYESFFGDVYAIFIGVVDIVTILIINITYKFTQFEFGIVWFPVYYVKNNYGKSIYPKFIIIGNFFYIYLLTIRDTIHLHGVATNYHVFVIAQINFNTVYYSVLE